MLAQKKLVKLSDAPISKSRFSDIFFVDNLNGWIYDSNVYNTTDGGNTWKKQVSLLGTGRSIEFMDKDTGIAGTLQGYISRTTNGGNTWTTKLDTVFIGSGVCGLSHIGNKFFGCGAYYGNPRFYISNDAGSSWLAVHLDSLIRGLVDCHFFDEMNGIISGSGKDSSSRFVLLRTNDGGLSWRIVCKVGGSPLSDNYVWKIYPIDDDKLAASLQGVINGKTTILKSNDRGYSWEVITTNIAATDVQGVCFENENEGWLGGWYDGVYHTRDGGYTWQYKPYGQGLNRFFRLPNGQILASGKSIYKIEDNATEIEESFLPNKNHRWFAISPNPSKGLTKISFELDYATGVTLLLVDATGRLVERLLRADLEKGNHIHNINTTIYPKGIYYITLLTHETHFSEKLIIEK